MKKLHSLTSILLLLWLSFSCTPIIRLDEVLPTAAFNGLEVQELPAALSTQEMKLKMGIRFVYKNPYKEALPIPAHRFSIDLNGDAMPGMPLNMTAFNIPAEGTVIRTYPVTFDLNPQGILKGKGVLGKDNVLTFSSQFKINLANMVDSLGNRLNLDLPENNSQGQKLFKALLDKKLGERIIELNHSQTIRLPAIPQILPPLSSNPIQVRFLGQMEQLDLSPIKNGLEPMVDLMVDLNEKTFTTDPFISMMNAEIDLGIAGKVNVVDYLMVTTMSPFFPDAKTRWTNFKDKYAPASGTPVFNHMVQTFMGDNVNINQSWNNFTTNWENFKQQPSVIEYPGPQVTGLEVIVPFRIKNTNQFAITAPAFFADASLNQFHPIQFSAGPVQSSVSPERSIGANQTANMEVRLVLNWTGSQFNQGILDMIQGKSLQPNLSGETIIDLGYGPTRLKLDLQQMMMKIGE